MKSLKKHPKFKRIRRSKKYLSYAPSENEVIDENNFKLYKTKKKENKERKKENIQVKLEKYMQEYALKLHARNDNIKILGNIDLEYKNPHDIGINTLINTKHYLQRLILRDKVNVRTGIVNELYNEHVKKWAFDALYKDSDNEWVHRIYVVGPSYTFVIERTSRSLVTVLNNSPTFKEFITEKKRKTREERTEEKKNMSTLRISGVNSSTNIPKFFTLIDIKGIKRTIQIRSDEECNIAHVFSRIPGCSSKTYYLTNKDNIIIDTNKQICNLSNGSILTLHKYR